MSNNIKKKIYLTFPKAKTTEAVICDMYDKYKVRFNVRTASVTQEIGLIGLELEGTAERIEEAIKYFESRGVGVEPVDMDVMAG
ncbi:MAG: NIL domain-containing protein [Deltaproteobacteria bacterium]|nr:NIL domain-containing protein [Deltaproteobacteria bacterium]